MSMKQPTTKIIAYEILKGFEKSFRLYNRITREAKKRFEKAQWQAVQQASKDRIALYSKILNETVTELYTLLYPHQQKIEFWQELKQTFSRQLANHPQFELAETFYNSVIGRIFQHEKIDDNYMFMLPSRCYLSGSDRPNIINTFNTDRTVKTTLQQLFSHYRFMVPFENYQRDLFNLTAVVKQRLNMKERLKVRRVEMLQNEFYRGKAAYIIGRICFEDGYRPFGYQ